MSVMTAAYKVTRATKRAVYTCLALKTSSSSLCRNRQLGLFFSQTSSYSSSSSLSSSSSKETFPDGNSSSDIIEADEMGRPINLKGLKSEVDRAVFRTFKKISKANERLSKAIELGDQYGNESGDIDIDELQIIADGLKGNLEILKDADEKLKGIKSVANPGLQTLFSTVQALGVSDNPPPKQIRGEKKEKGKPEHPRKPYLSYKSIEGLEIRVGRGATDNDLLSCDKQHRDGADWWMHASGCPGSHVIIRTHEDDIASVYPESVKDAALLAAVNSKASQGGKVSMI